MDLTQFKKNLGADSLSSVVVFLVALPLCMGVAIASGVNPATGLITGIIGGVLVGAIACSPLLVSGPAAGLTAIVWDIVQKHGVGGLGVALLMAGVIQMAAGALRLGQWFRAVSPAVINGMLGGIGVLLLASQFHVMLDDKPKTSAIKNLLTIPEAIYDGIFPINGSPHELAALLGILTIGTMLLWAKFRPAALKAVPAPLVAVVLATAIARIFSLPVKYVSVPRSLASVVTLPNAETLGTMFSSPIIIAAVTLAVVASAETLLAAAAVDQMHNGPRTKYDRELLAQGVGNTICGVLGALPMTGVIVRSAANVEAGAKSRASTMLHGLWMLLLVMAVPFALEWIPVSALAAVLVLTGYKLVNPAAIRALAKFGWAEVAIYVATVVGIVATDLLKGVILGLVMALFKVLLSVSKLEGWTEPDKKRGNNTTALVLRGNATFIRLPRLAALLESIPAAADVRVDIEDVHYIDQACLDLFASWEKRHVSNGGKVTLDWQELRSRAFVSSGLARVGPNTQQAA